MQQNNYRDLKHNLCECSDQISHLLHVRSTPDGLKVVDVAPVRRLNTSGGFNESDKRKCLATGIRLWEMKAE